jgi:hypothetical protein
MLNGIATWPMSYQRIGILLERQRHLEDALKSYRDSLVVLYRLAKPASAPPGLQQDLQSTAGPFH